MSSSSSSSLSPIPSSVHAVQMNNMATDQIIKGNYIDAAGTLSIALVSMRNAIRTEVFPIRNPAIVTSTSSSVSSSDGDGDAVMQHENDDDDDQYHRGFYFVSESSSSTNSKSSPDSNNSGNASRIARTSDLECGDWFLYEDPIEISYENAVASEKAVEIISFAIIYNLGLCHHLQAIDDLIQASESKRRPSTDSSKHNPLPPAQASLQRAVALYGQAQKLLVAHGLDNIEEMLHTMAITNNLGHAHHFLHNDPSAKVCFERLLNAIMYISESGEQGRRVLLSHEICVDGFLSNVMNLIGSSCAAPAA